MPLPRFDIAELERRAADASWMLLPAAYLALRRFRRLERENVQDDDWL